MINAICAAHPNLDTPANTKRLKNAKIRDARTESIVLEDYS